MSEAKESSISSEEKKNLENNLALMKGNDGGAPAVGFDVIIICATSMDQANFWQIYLDKTRGKLLLSTAVVLVVYEDWKGGAGNALGSLNAIVQADRLAIARGCFSAGVTTALVNGEISCALYHIAGKGTRLSPLQLSEFNNKPGVKLPVLATYEDRQLSILEVVIRQTSVYSVSHKGRLSVFWGDQVFIPSAKTGRSASHHVEILCKLGPVLNEEEWKERKMEEYGLIVVGTSDEAAQVEKVNYATAKRILQALGNIKSMGVSLGSFSISSRLLMLLLDAFKPELETKKGKLDTDPHWWMPLTLTEMGYVSAMVRRNTPEEWSISHYRRMLTLKEFLLREENSTGPRLGLFGAVDVGMAAYWWDYGRLTLYYQNALLLTENGDGPEALRSFLGVCRAARNGMCGDGLNVDAESVISGSRVTVGGDIKKSVLCHVRAETVHALGAVLNNVVARRIVAPSSNIIYNVIDTSEEGLVLEPGEVVVGVRDERGKQKRVYSSLDIDGGISWNEILREGQGSFSNIFESNLSIDIEKAIIENDGEFLEAFRNLTFT